MTDRLPGAKFLVFALVCAVSAVWLVLVTGNLRLFPDTVSYEAVLADAQGLTDSDSVHLAGVRVGRVTDIAVERGNAVVTFNVDRDVAPTESWEVGVRWRNVIGNRYLYLYPVGEGAPLAPDGRIPVEQSRPQADIGVFFNRITPLLRAIDAEQQNILLAALNEALAGSEERTQRLVADLGSLTGTLADREDEIRSVIEQGTNLLTAYAERDEEIRAFLDDFADVSSTLEARNDELVDAVTDIGEVQRELGDLLADNDEEIRSLTGELATVTDVIGRNRDELERALGNTRHGFATYMLISRWGQWFNVRAVATQVQQDGAIVHCTTEAGGECAEPSSMHHPDAGSASRAPQALDAVAVRSLRGGGASTAGSEPGERRHAVGGEQ